MFTRYADGETANEILDDLHKRNVFAATKRTLKHKSAFYTLLKNRKYIGEYKYGEYILTSKLFCGKDGAMMVGTAARFLLLMC